VSLVPRSLFGRTAAILALTLLVFTLLAVGVSAWFVVFPVGKRSADDFAALVVLAAQTRVELPPGTESDFRQELLQQHHLQLADDRGPLAADPSPHPYLRFLEAALERRTGHPVTVMASSDGTLWVDIPVQAGMVRLGFDRERVGARPILVFAVMLVSGALLTLVAAVVVARLVVRPLETVSHAVGEVGYGRMPPALPETGPEEMVVLTQAFNRMSVQVHELLENRTVLLAGISHDLRTPLTRLRLALEMLEQDTISNPNPDLVATMRRDLEAMNELIGQFLELARGLGEVRSEQTDLRALVESLVADARRGGTDASLDAPGTCRVPTDPAPLRRILTNLLDNAVCYGSGQPIDITLAYEGNSVVVRICDRGPGIPESEREAVFRPFHRLEGARSRETGGTGLGLAIARQLADQHGWEICLLAREGGGTVAQLSMPG
jgi:two-component system osmolarity sensor histidine kinase EnvZ